MRWKYAFLTVAALVFAGCISMETDVIETGRPSSSSSRSSEEQPTVNGALEQVPSELSVRHFSTMTLSGTDLRIGAVLENHDAYVRHAITYRSNGLLISGIMNIPIGPGPFPLLILNHGYIDPAVYTQGRGLRREQDYFARNGFAVLHTDYRGHAGSDESPDVRKVYDAGLEYAMDSANAILAVREANLPTIDATRVGMLGHSLGGGVTLNILTGKPGLVTAAVLYAPVSADAWTNFMRWRSMREEGDRTRELMQTYEENPAAWDALSSKSMLSEVQAPILLFHGTRDADVPFVWSEDLVLWLQATKKSVELVTYEGEGHEFAREWSDFMKRSADFFDRHLQPAPTSFVSPISRGKERITKKPFGIRVSPDNSPVSPERFSGFHTGTDYELLEGENPHDVSAIAMCDGDVIFSGTVGGYGGVAVQRCVVDSETVTVLYGHLSPASLVGEGTRLVAGENVGTLGTGFSEETAGERPHLHVGVHRGAGIEYKGYVTDEQSLAGWMNAQELTPE